MTEQDATAADLANHLAEGIEAPTGAEADRMLLRASELIDFVTSGASERAWITDDVGWQSVLTRATVEQCEYWLEVGEEHDVVGLTGNAQAGRLMISHLPGRLGPRALRTLLHYGLYWAGAGIQ
jgi:hypothetical protein